MKNRRGGILSEENKYFVKSLFIYINKTQINNTRRIF